MILSQFHPFWYDIHPNWIWGFKSHQPFFWQASSDCTHIRSCKWPEAGHWTIFNQTNGKQTNVLQLLIMTMKLLAFYKGIQFAINPFKSCMRQRNAFQTDILFKVDLENDLLSMTLTYNHFENKCNQLRHLKNPAIDTKIVKIGPWTQEICHFHYTVGGHLGFCWNRGLKGSKN